MKIEKVYIDKNSPLVEYALNLIINNWPGKDSYKETYLKRKNKMASDETIKGYALLKDDLPIGCFLICNDDIRGYKQYNPNIACVCIENRYRGKGYSYFLMEKVKEALEELNYHEAYLKTSLINFYEKMGWEYIETIDIGGEKERVYKISI